MAQVTFGGNECGEFHSEYGQMHGTLIPIACDCWYKSDGSTILRMFKFLDTDGLPVACTSIEMLTCQDKFYDGIPTVEYVCNCIIAEHHYIVKIIFHVESRRWNLLFPEVG
ncbi:MAG: hypothetical protein ACK5MN_02470 [Lachnospiraceae bacterium]